MFRWLESRIDPFARFDEGRTPPNDVRGFMWSYLRPVRGWFGVLFVASLLVGIFESSLYLLIGWFVDLLASTPPDRVFAEHGTTLMIVGALILVVRPLLHFGHEALSNQVIVPQTTGMIRWRTHTYTLGHALTYFQSDFAGRLANRIIQVGPAVREIAVTILDTLLYVAIFAITALGMFSTISLWLALPMALWIAGYLVLLRYFVPKAQARSLVAADARSALVGRVVDSYTNILTVKLFARASEERSAVREALERHTKAFLDSQRLITGVTGVLSVMNSGLLFSTAGLSLWLWSRGGMTSGEAAAGLALVMRILAMSGWVMQTVRGVFENVGVVQESMQTISRPHAIVDRAEAAELAVPRGEIRFDGVSFHYGREEGIIERLSFTIRPGEKVGLVGASGAGKSTIVSLLLRLHELEDGRILIDGQDIAGVTQDSLRSQIAVVTQDTSLLHRSIRDNIAYGRMEADAAEVERAARLAHAHEFIQDLSDDRGRQAYAAQVGRARREALGRPAPAHRHRPRHPQGRPILVLDEATSALDSEVEAAIQDSLESLMEGKTVLAIAHRLSTIAALDRLIVLDRGRIVEEGTHDALLTHNGVYARLWHRQSGGFLKEGEEQVEAAE
jgi:ATP-binding cassette subfamily B multidrug efflux pump